MSKELDDLLNATLNDALAAEQSRVRVHIESRRYGKHVTVLDGFDASLDLDTLAREMKRGLGTGGTVKGRTIELQGDHARAAKPWLLQRGFQVQ
ncbi:MAG: translation initiation factor [Halobacteriales archaeon]|nr:translation initiation factor [Halobacteriales archaeon]